MNKELLMILSSGFGGIFFALGGTGLSFPTKWIRRFLLPLFFGFIALLAGHEWWKCAGMSAGFIVSFCLGYGQTKSYIWKFIVGIMFVLPTVFIGFSLWQVITPLIWILLFRLSNCKILNQSFVWKICECITGFLIGITVASLL